MITQILLSIIIGIIAYFGGKWYLSRKNIEPEKKKRIYIIGFFIAFALSLTVQIIFRIQLFDMFS
jgi:hypothetical protein